jgi:predicted HicB family RNase H-like nuclease
LDGDDPKVALQVNQQEADYPSCIPLAEFRNQRKGRIMDQILRRKQSFLLRLPLTLREDAAKIAQHEGISLNHFIGLALAEKLSRLPLIDTLHTSATAHKVFSTPRHL